MSPKSQLNPEREDLMVARVTYNIGEAHIIAGRLETEGIPTIIIQEPAGSAYGITVGALGAIRLVVRASDYERAMAILETDEAPLLNEDVDQIIFDDDEPYDEYDDEE